MVLDRIQARALDVKGEVNLRATGSVPALLTWAPGRLGYSEEGKERRREERREESWDGEQGGRSPREALASVSYLLLPPPTPSL